MTKLEERIKELELEVTQSFDLIVDYAAYEIEFGDVAMRLNFE